MPANRRDLKLRVALSMVLIVLAGLFTKSLANISRVDPGLRTEGMITFSVSPQRNGYTLPRSSALFDRLEEEIVALPGVTPGQAEAVIEGRGASPPPAAYRYGGE